MDKLLERRAKGILHLKLKSLQSLLSTSAGHPSSPCHFCNLTQQQLTLLSRVFRLGYKSESLLSQRILCCWTNYHHHFLFKFLLPNKKNSCKSDFKSKKTIKKRKTVNWIWNTSKKREDFFFFFKYFGEELYMKKPH